MTNHHESTDESTRGMFRNVDGRIQVGRIMENIIPGLVIGCFVVFATFKVMESDVNALKSGQLSQAKTLDDIGKELKSTVAQAAADRSEIVKLQAQMTAYVGQQVSMNQSMDTRMARIEGAFMPMVPRRGQ